MAKKTTTVETVSVDTVADVAVETVNDVAVETVETVVVETLPTTIPVKAWVNGVYMDVEIPVVDAPAIDRMFSDSPAVKAEKERIRKEKIAADQKAARDAIKAKKMADPEFVAKMEEKEKAKEAKNAKLAGVEARRLAREARKTAEKTERETLLEESKSNLPIDRLVVAKISKKYAHGGKDEGIQRGWVAKLTYINKKGMETSLDHTIDLDKQGHGTLETAYQDARNALLEMLSDAV